MIICKNRILFLSRLSDFLTNAGGSTSHWLVKVSAKREMATPLGQVLMSLFVIWFLLSPVFLRKKLNFSCADISVADSEFPRRGKALTPKMKMPTNYLSIFSPKTAWKWKKLDRGGGGALGSADAWTWHRIQKGNI